MIDEDENDDRGPDEAGIDHAFLRSMTQSPMSAEDWRRCLDEHAAFLDSCQYARWGSWQVLSVSGLPLAVWDGTTGSEGKQINLNFANLTGLSLEWACIPCAGLPGVMAEGVCFRGAELSRSLLTDAALDGADFSLARLDHVDFSRASLRGANFKKAIVSDADFENCDLRGADFRGAKFARTRLVGANTEGALGLPASMPE
ncbi:pentapeptide repeat-containing protein [Nannocystaceae bacterium ST9]